MNIHNTDKLVWNTLCEILNNSSLIKEELKSRELGKKLDTQKEVKKKVKHLTQQRKYLEDKINEYESREDDLYDWYVKGEISKKRLEELKKKFVELRKEKFEELERMEIDIQSIIESGICVMLNLDNSNFSKIKGGVGIIPLTRRLKANKKLAWGGLYIGPGFYPYRD